MFCDEFTSQIICCMTDRPSGITLILRHTNTPIFARASSLSFPSLSLFADDVSFRSCFVPFSGWLVVNLLYFLLLLDCVVSLNVLCVTCVDPALMRKSPSADSNVGKPGRLTVYSLSALTRPAVVCTSKTHLSHCLLVLCYKWCSFSPGTPECYCQNCTAWGQRTVIWQI